MQKNVTSPRPPASTSSIRITRPAREKTAMSSTESPVTQIAETAMNSASTSDAPLPDTYENGQTKSDVPTTTRKKKYVNNLPFALFILKLMILTENAHFFRLLRIGFPAPLQKQKHYIHITLDFSFFEDSQLSC